MTADGDKLYGTTKYATYRTFDLYSFLVDYAPNILKDDYEIFQVVPDKNEHIIIFKRKQ
jgi:hypothetical protein